MGDLPPYGVGISFANIMWQMEKRHSLASRYLEDFAARTLNYASREGWRIVYTDNSGKEPLDLVEHFIKNPSESPARYNIDC